MREVLSQFLRFGVVGTLGFLLDYAVLRLAVEAGAGPYGGRVVSYLAAATGVYAMNRAWTFRDRRGQAPVVRQWGLYVLLNLLGFAANYGTYAAVITFSEWGARHLILGVAAGSVAGMFINFALARQVIFRGT